MLYTLVLPFIVNVYFFYSSPNLKTYQIWKASFYLAPLFILTLSFVFSNFIKKSRRREAVPPLLVTILLSICIAGFTSSSDFRTDSKTLPFDLRASGQVKSLKKYWDSYDLRPAGFGNPQLFALISDDVFFSSRSSNPSFGKIPKRGFLWVVNRSSCSTKFCKSESKGLRLIGEYESFLIFVKQE